MKGTLLSTTVKDNDPLDSGAPCDAFGHNTHSRTTVIDHTQSNKTHRVDSLRTVSHDTTNWFIGRMTASQESRAVNGAGDATKDRENSYTYNAKGRLASMVRERNQSAPIKLTINYGYDGFGHRTSETVTPSEGGATPRTETVSYDSRGRVLKSSEPYFYNGSNSNNAAWNTPAYDVLGRVIERVDPTDSLLGSIVSSWSYDSTAGGSAGIGHFTWNSKFPHFCSKSSWLRYYIQRLV